MWEILWEVYILKRVKKKNPRNARTTKTLKTYLKRIEALDFLLERLDLDVFLLDAGLQQR